MNPWRSARHDVARGCALPQTSGTVSPIPPAEAVVRAPSRSDPARTWLPERVLLIASVALSGCGEAKPDGTTSNGDEKRDAAASVGSDHEAGTTPLGTADPTTVSDGGAGSHPPVGDASLSDSADEPGLRGAQSRLPACQRPRPAVARLPRARCTSPPCPPLGCVPSASIAATAVRARRTVEPCRSPRLAATTSAAAPKRRGACFSGFESSHVERGRASTRASVRSPKWVARASTQR